MVTQAARAGRARGVLPAAGASSEAPRVLSALAGGDGFVPALARVSAGHASARSWQKRKAMSAMIFSIGSPC